MRLSEGLEWALHCCALLAELPAGTVLSTARLAAFFDLPAAYLAKQLQALSRAGLVEAATGPGGGYRLKRPADEISLRDVTLAIEGNEPCFRCREIRQRGPSAVAKSLYRKPCGIARAMWAAEQVWLEQLARTTIADLARLGLAEVPIEQRRLAKRWLAEV